MQYLWLKSAPSAFSKANYSVSCYSLTLDKKLAMGHSDVRPTHSMANSLFRRGYALPWSKYSLLKHFRHLQTHIPLFLSKATCSVILKHDKHTVSTPRKFKKLKKKKKANQKNTSCFIHSDQLGSPSGHSTMFFVPCPVFPLSLGLLGGNRDLAVQLCHKFRPESQTFSINT